jgi:hypothetical protein
MVYPSFILFSLGTRPLDAADCQFFVLSNYAPLSIQTSDSPHIRTISLKRITHADDAFSVPLRPMNVFEKIRNQGETT